MFLIRILLAFASLLVSPCVAVAQSSMTVTVTITASNAGAPLFFRAKGQGFDQSGYVSYSAKTKRPLYLPQRNKERWPVEDDRKEHLHQVVKS
jgi:hypothetical protein